MYLGNLEGLFSPGKINKQDLKFDDITLDINRVYSDIYMKLNRSVEFYDLSIRDIGYTLDDLKEYVQSEVKKLYENRSLS